MPSAEVATSALTWLSRSRSSSSSRFGRLAGVGGDVEALLAQEAGHPLGLGDGEHVDDARAGQRAQRLGDPGVALQHRQLGHDGQPQRGPGQGAAQRHGLVAQLGGDVGRHPLVGGGGGGEHRGARRQREQGAGEPLVVGAEVEAPVRDAVRLVDDEHPARAQQVGQLRGEDGVGEPLRGDEQHVELPAAELADHPRPVVDVGGVDRRRPQPGPLGGADLVAHQREQRRDDQRRAGPPLPQRRGGRPVDRRLAPARGLDDEHPPPALDELLDGADLVLARRGLRPGHRGDGAGQDGGGGGAESRC